MVLRLTTQGDMVSQKQNIVQMMLNIMFSSGAIKYSYLAPTFVNSQDRSSEGVDVALPCMRMPYLLRA